MRRIYSAMLCRIGVEGFGYLCYICDSSTISSTSEIGTRRGIEDNSQDRDDRYDNHYLDESES